MTLRYQLPITQTCSCPCSYAPPNARTTRSAVARERPPWPSAPGRAASPIHRANRNEMSPCRCSVDVSDTYVPSTFGSAAVGRRQGRRVAWRAAHNAGTGERRARASRRRWRAPRRGMTDRGWLRRLAHNRGLRSESTPASDYTAVLTSALSVDCRRPFVKS
jgi:hypothetical protein